MLKRRAMTLAEQTERSSGMVTEAGMARGLALELRPTDVVISPYAKSGTTWLQQIVHGLRTRGDMDFDDISRVVPWIEMSTDLGIELDAEQAANPRAFKSHLPADRVPQGGRYLLSVRDPGDALVSAFRFTEGWFLEPGAVAIEDFARERFLPERPGRDYWYHLLSWWPRRHDDDVLLMAYEEMRADLTATVRRIAEFIGVALDDELLATVERQSSLEFMTDHKDRFDDRLMRERSEEVAGLPSGSDSSKVRAGEIGASRVELPVGVRAELDAVWRARITSELGFADYEALRLALRQGR